MGFEAQPCRLLAMGPWANLPVSFSSITQRYYLHHKDAMRIETSDI